MAKFWVAIESKTFEVSIEEIKGKLKGIIVERSRGFSSWIRFGASGLRKLLECFEECCREEKKGRLVKVWEEEGRKFRLERRVNGAGRYVLCSVVDVEAKRFCLVFPEGKGVIGGWAILAVKLRALGIVTKKDDKGVEATQISSKKKDATIDDEEERCSGKKKQGEIRSFLDVAKGPAGRVGEELWLQVGGRGLRRREEVLGRCLVGRWEGAVMEMELDSLKNWGKRSWNLRKGVKVMKMGEPFFLLEFEDEGEAERVLNRGTRRFKDRLLHLERWNEEAGCLRDGNQTKEVWVRVVGLPLHCWSEEMFKSIGDCCGGLVGVDEATKNLSQLQWARILVKNNGNFFPGTLNLVVKSFCYAVRLWWEVQPRVSAVEPMMNLRRKEGERMREKGDEQSRAGNSGGKEKEGWRAAGADGSGAVRKRKGKEKCDGDKIGVSVEGLAGYSKKEGEVGSSEKDGVEGLDSCKCGCEVTQPSNCQRLEHESTEVWVENQKVINGSRARWEKGQSSRGGEWAAHEGPLSVKKKFLGQMDNRGEKWASRVDIPLLQRDGLGLLDNRPKVVEKDGQDDGPSSFQKDGLGRLEHRSRVAGGEGQPILASVWAPSAYKSPWDELSVNARASSCLEPAEEFFAEDSLIGGMGPAAAIGTPERCSITDECFLEEASSFMVQKLFSLIDQTSVPDNPDVLQNQEVLLPGHLITIYLKEKLQEWLYKARRLLQDEINKRKNFEFSSLAHVKKVMDKNPSRQISLAVENMLKTGRLVTQSGLDLQQRAGMTVQAERLNFLRFLSHFRAVHRGASFAGLRTTSVRKLLPEAWGFLCPVHTPDGEPCGLLNHMASTCRITSYFDSRGSTRDFFKIRMSILSVLIGIGMTPALPKLVQAGPPEVLSVILDGRVVGSIPSSEVETAVNHLRRLKVSAISVIPDDLEVGYIPLSMGGAYPGLYLFTSPSRFVRPVRNISIPSEEGHDIELIGPFEQVYMEIRCPDGSDGGRRNIFPATHEEIHPTGMLSVVASLTPWSDHNQSPRNMYQCQMGKQTMAFSSQAINCRADQKLYHLQTPQTPIVRTSAYVKYSMDEFPTGTNAIVAVLAYSGYDMEDAMILNKSSVDRGLCHGQIYQTETIDLSDENNKSDRGQRMFRRSNVDKSANSLIDSDGLPYVGQMINPNEPYCSIYNEVTSSTRATKLKGSEPVIVDYVALDAKNKKHPQKVNIRFRRPRNPIIGDKFSSRHGQKGVCSQLWPDIDMPFSGVTGMRPDLIINPHAFPSRMTIAMLLESVAAKGGSLHGKFVDATPFSDSLRKANGEAGSESSSLVDELGSMLTSYGFNYHGVEVLYSGFYGTELTCEIFIGPVYYQRLRHMVSDKFQVRSTGTVDQVTRQPIKGRKRGGGIRFGEMERDSMLAHGAAYLLHDRLHTCSDHHIADVCSLCGSILTTSIIQPQKRAVREIGGLPPGRAPKKVTCHACQTSKGMETVSMPYIFRFLAAELAAMNIKMTLQLSNGAGA